MKNALHKDPVTVTLSQGDYEELVKRATEERARSKEILRKFVSLLRSHATTDFIKVADFIEPRIDQMFE